MADVWIVFAVLGVLAGQVVLFGTVVRAVISAVAQSRRAAPSALSQASGLRASR